jgi:hypothetical protein
MMKWTAALAAMTLAGAAMGAAAQTPPPPSAATLALARRVAASDDFLALVQVTGRAQTTGIERGLGDLTPDEKTKVEAIAAAKMAEGSSRVVDKMSVIYAATFTPDELISLAAFLETPAGKAYSERLIKVLPALGEGMKGFDFKAEVLKETCAQINKGCPAKIP